MAVASSRSPAPWRDFLLTVAAGIASAWAYDWIRRRRVRASLTTIPGYADER